MAMKTSCTAIMEGINAVNANKLKYNIMITICDLKGDSLLDIATRKVKRLRMMRMVYEMAMELMVER